MAQRDRSEPARKCPACGFVSQAKDARVQTMQQHLRTCAATKLLAKCPFCDHQRDADIAAFATHIAQHLRRNSRREPDHSEPQPVPQPVPQPEPQPVPAEPAPPVVPQPVPSSPPPPSPPPPDHPSLNDDDRDDADDDLEDLSVYLDLLADVALSNHAEEPQAGRPLRDLPALAPDHRFTIDQNAMDPTTFAKLQFLQWLKKGHVSQERYREYVDLNVALQGVQSFELPKSLSSLNRFARKYVFNAMPMCSCH